MLECKMPLRLLQTCNNMISILSTYDFQICQIICIILIKYLYRKISQKTQKIINKAI